MSAQADIFERISLQQVSWSYTMYTELGGGDFEWPAYKDKIIIHWKLEDRILWADRKITNFLKILEISYSSAESSRHCPILHVYCVGDISSWDVYYDYLLRLRSNYSYMPGLPALVLFQSGLRCLREPSAAYESDVACSGSSRNSAAEVNAFRNCKIHGNQGWRCELWCRSGDQIMPCIIYPSAALFSPSTDKYPGTF